KPAAEVRLLSLALQPPLELLARIRRVRAAGGTVPEPILTAGHPLPHPGRAGLWRDQDVEGELLEPRMARPQPATPAGLIREAEAVLRERRLTVRVDEVETALALTRPPRPGSSAGRVPARRVHGQRERADTHAFARLHDIDPRNRRHRQRDVVLRVIRRGPAASPHGRTRRARRHR